MIDYIKREDAIEFVESLASTMSVCINKDECVGMSSMKKRAIGALHDVPAADVRENVHAKAIPDFEQFSPFEGYEGGTIQTGWKCSACGSVRIGRFCADCGAQMDGGDES